jgi:hypothetical protein
MNWVILVKENKERKQGYKYILFDYSLPREKKERSF